MRQSRRVNPVMRRSRLAAVRLPARIATVICMTLSLLTSFLLGVTPVGEAAAVGKSSSRTASLSITKLTPVVTASSGLHIVVKISNKTSNVLPVGTLTTSTNPTYTFVSKTDIQQWAEGGTPIPTPTTLSTLTIPAVAAKSSISVTVNITAQDTGLKKITSWGPKPLLLDYSTGSDSSSVPIQAHSFLTRSSDGLSSVKTPAMSLTVAMPLTSRRWSSNSNALSSLLSTRASKSTTGSAESTSASNIMTLSTPNADSLRTWKRVLSEHPLLQSVVDPDVLSSSQVALRVSGISQTSSFDITAAATISASGLSSAGISNSSWNAAKGTSLARTTLGDSATSVESYAWQGNGQWTEDALETALKQGFTTVIAQGSFDQQDSSTVHTGKYVVPTDSGNITVLAAQKVLSGLAQGNASSTTADAEDTDAGRLVRFMAQSAFYQMQEPYVTRNPLVLLGSSTTAEEASELMTALESASWIKLTDLKTLSRQKAYLSGSNALAVVPQSSGISATQRKFLRDMLSSLAKARSEIRRFSRKVLAESPSESSSGDTEDNERADSSDIWINNLLNAQSLVARRSFAWTGTTSSRASLVRMSSSIPSGLYDAISITPSETITVVSETASMPVTVRNGNPYPIRIKLSSLTDSMEIVTSRISETTVPALSETQVTFTVRVATSGSATAHISLLDRDGESFSKERTTTITSTLQINDKSGLVIIIIAMIFAILGFWRQFHRQKDPDE